MADTSDTNIVKKEPDAPAPDPITSRSTSSILLICALLLTAVLAWALFDEVYGQRPWKNVQQTFVQRYTRHLKRFKRQGNPTEKEIKERPEYQELDSEAKAASEAAEPRKREIDKQIEFIEAQLAAVTDPFQDKRGRITVANYHIEEAGSDRKKNELRKKVQEQKDEQVAVRMPVAPGSTKTKEEKLNYVQLEQRFYQLKDEKAKLVAERGELLKESNELAKKRDDYVKENIAGLSTEQVNALLKKYENFDYSIKQINVQSADIVDRCETCHLGVREPLTLTPALLRPSLRSRRVDDMARAFVSHPNKELLEIHNPDRFGCSSCHGGNGRATTNVEKAHGQNKHWLFPLHRKDNVEAGCQQCHSNDRVLQGAPTLTLGKDLFQNRGCIGCHRYEGFDRETDALTSTRQLVKQLEEERAENERQSRQATAEAGTAPDEAAAQQLLARAENLRVTNSQIESRMDQLNTQARYLMQDQKKVGPNLKDVRLKLRKEWIPVWLQDPQKFRPGTKMPTYWRLDGEGGRPEDHTREENERKAIAAYLWQESFEGQIQQQPEGDRTRGQQLFETRGCMACHSIGEGDPKKDYVGGDFAANLQRVGDKANFEYIVRWIHNPRERWQPYCPEEKRDLTPEDYANHNKPFVFDTGDNSKCPNDGAELQVQNMTVMPNFRLTDADARDIATYLFSLSPRSEYPDASYMDDPNLKEQGRTLIKQYGCAGCHEIKGFEDEQRIGKELTTEGSTPIERLDFALMTHPAEQGHHPYEKVEGRKEQVEKGVWYNRRGFFVNKIEWPWIYDEGKEKEPKDMLRMPDPYMTPEWKNALTTFLLGSVGMEGANVPRSMFYNPVNQQKDIQEGWWIIKKYNCMGCHTVQVGQPSVLAGLERYRTPEGKEQLPPGLTTEGARVDPNWLLNFLRDPSLSTTPDGDPLPGIARNGGAGGGGATSGNNASRVNNGNLIQGGASTGGGNNAASNSNQASASANQQASSGGQPSAATETAVGNMTPQRIADAMRGHGTLKPQPGADRNGVRVYLQARMPTFTFSPNELRALVRFFLAVSAQQEPYIKEKVDPLDDQERELARALFTSAAAPCLKCHVTGDPARDRTASAPNFLQAGDRLKPNWTFRWLLDPQRIMPGTAMPSDLFKKEGERWVFNGPLPDTANNYQGDHAKLLVRYMLQLTPEEQRRAAAAAPAPTSGSGQPAANATQATPAAPVETSSNRRRQGTSTRGSSGGRTHRASRDADRRGRQQTSSWHGAADGNTRTRASRAPEISAMVRRRPAAFMP
ncbi:MAG TPA: c-type cytochrome [Pyrinomonadaceae bacterium]